MTDQGVPRLYYGLDYANGIGSAVTIQVSFDSEKKFIWFTPYGWQDGAGIMIDPKNADKLNKAECLADVYALEVDPYGDN